MRAFSDWDCIGASAMGVAHRRRGTANEDAFRLVRVASGASIVVSDGVGSAVCFRSNDGSRIAVDVAQSLAESVLESRVSLDSWIAAFPESACALWSAAVSAHMDATPFTEHELFEVSESAGNQGLSMIEDMPALAYGATLLLAIAKGNEVAVSQIGDGDILVVDSDATTSFPLSTDSIARGTSPSLGLPDSASHFRSTLVRATPALVVASSDGWRNSFASAADVEAVGPDLLHMLAFDGFDAVHGSLPSWVSRATEDGSGDDVTLCLLHRTTLSRE